jgi:hypothetical protein
MLNDITVILNGYKRTNGLTEQYESIKKSTITIKEIMLWYNYPGSDELINYDLVSKIPTALSNVNLGVWARFAYALNAKTKYVCIFDDDIVPGIKWFENCLNTIQKVNGLLGGVGLLYLNPKPVECCSYYDSYHRYGWVDGGQSFEINQVDLIGHSWFFEKEWLSYYWREFYNNEYFTCGEDMHFSYMLQKYANIKTYVPPHPINDIEMWSNKVHTKYACDKNSMWETNQVDPNGLNFKTVMNKFFIEQRKRGWKLIKES